jgi:queuine tRNA-ribosyltransferase
LYTETSFLNLHNARHASSYKPVDAACACPVCTRFTRAYLRHLYASNEILAPVLGTLHNLHFFLGLMERVRKAIETGTFRSFARAFLARRRRAARQRKK